MAQRLAHALGTALLTWMVPSVLSYGETNSYYTSALQADDPCESREGGQCSLRMLQRSGTQSQLHELAKPSASNKARISHLESQASLTSPGKLYDQCGGSSWTGSASCQDGLECKYIDKWMSQCVQAHGAAAITTPAPSAATKHPSTSPATGALQPEVLPPESHRPPEMKYVGQYEFMASTTRYGDAKKSACASLNTAELVAGTDWYNVAAAENMFGRSWCGKKWMGCFQCAKGRFLNQAKNGFTGPEIKLIVGDLCPYVGNERWCEARTTDLNSVGFTYHFDFSHPPPGIDNNLLAFTPIECHGAIESRLRSYEDICSQPER